MKKTKFYVPVFYSKPSHTFASIDAIKNTDYYQTAIDVVNNTQKYILMDDIYKKVETNPIKDFNVKFNIHTGFFRTVAFEMNLKK